MENYKSILAEARANEEQAKALDSKADALYKKAEISAAETVAERVALRKSITEDAEAEAGSLYTEAENLRSINRILAENARASFAAEAAEIIREIMKKYAGKRYGEKTREKVREEAKTRGISFYFDGYRSQDAIHVSALTEEGYTNYSMKDVTIFAADQDGHRAEFITEENKVVDFSEVCFVNHYKYTEDPAEKRAELEKAYAKYCEAYEAAKAAQDALNALIPSSGKRFDAIGHLSPWQKF